MLNSITPLILTFNEAPNIGRALSGLAWAKRIVVVDSGSTDETLSILKQHAQVEVYTRVFDSFAEQCNFGLARVTSEWVLSLDADYELSDELVKEIAVLQPDAAVSGYRARFVYRIHGRALRGSLYPPRTVLYRVQGARYVNEGHGHRVQIDGAARPLRGVIYHDDRKPLSRWFDSQRRYAAAEAQHLLNASSDSLSRIDRLRRMGWPAPLLILPYVLLRKGCFFDGRAGLFYAFQRLLAECLIAIEVNDRRLGKMGAAAH